jgi:hypothetical protein
MPIPKDIKFTFYDNEFCKLTMKFEFFSYPYDKGSDGRITIETEESVGQYDDYKNDCTEIKIKSKKLFAGLTYKDLIAISKWAKNAANTIKSDCNRKNYHGPKFDDKSSVND